MTVKINADTSDGLKFVSDTSGAIDLQSNGTTKASLDANGNLDIQGQYSGKGNSPYFVARIGTTHSATDNAYTKVQFDTIISESTSSGFDTTNDKYVVPSGQGGIYQIEAHINMQSSANTTMVNSYIRLYVNGSGTYPLVVNDFTGNYIKKFSPSFSRVISLSAGDELEIYGFSNITSGTLEFTNQSMWSMFKLIT